MSGRLDAIELEESTFDYDLVMFDFGPLRSDWDEDDACVVQPRQDIVKNVKVDDVCHTRDSVANMFASGRSFDDLIGDLDRGRLDPLREGFLELEQLSQDEEGRGHHASALARAYHEWSSDLHLGGGGCFNGGAELQGKELA